MASVNGSACILVMSLVIAHVAASVGAAESTWSFTDINNVQHRPFESKETRAVVLVFIMTDCPIANYYQPTLSRLEKDFSSKGFAFYMLHADPEVKAAAARKHVKDFAITAPVILDHSQQIAKRVGATHAPQAFVIDRSGKTRYQGRIDDTYVALGEKRPKATSNDLRDAIESILAGREIAHPETKPIGCHIFFDE